MTATADLASRAIDPIPMKLRSLSATIELGKDEGLQYVVVSVDEKGIARIHYTDILGLLVCTDLATASRDLYLTSGQQAKLSNLIVALQGVLL